MASDVTIRCWAPGATQVEAVLTRGLSDDPSGPLGVEDLVDCQRVPLSADGDEMFSIELPDGTDYLLSVDGAEPRPDPRSAWQPWGVHGPSRAFDTSAFRWDSDWDGASVLGRVFYEMHVGTFTPEGTLDAAISKLGHLAELGVEVVELMPLAAFPGQRGWGYDGVYWYAVQDCYGGPAALQRFVNAAHKAGLAVCLDVVYNHFGPAGNYAPTFAPFFTDRHQTPWGDAINLDDEGCAGVRRFIIENACRWVREFRIDALRLDAVHALVDDSPTHLLAELSARVDDLESELQRPCTLIAESDLNQPAMITPRRDGGLGIDGQWADDVHHALHSYFTEETFGYYVDFGSAEVLAKALEKVFVHDGSYSTFRRRTWGAPVSDDVDRWRFVVFTQNHDQVGNRGKGDRPDDVLSSAASAAAAAFLLLSPFTPLLFQGQEWAASTPFTFFTDHDADLGQAVSEGRMREFASHGWESVYGPNPAIPDPQDPATFLQAKLDWSERSRVFHRDMLAWYRTVLSLRARQSADNHVATRYGDGWFEMAHGGLSVVYAREATDLEGFGELVAMWGSATLDDAGLHLSDNSVAIQAR